LGIFDSIKNALYAKPESSRNIFNTEAKGASGTENFAGYINEEYLRELRGTEAANIYDKMRRSDTQIKMVLSAVKNPIKSAQWFVAPASDDPKDELVAKAIHCAIFEKMDKPWRVLLGEMLSMVDYGYSLFEYTHKIIDDPEYGKMVVFKNLGWRSPKTIERFNINRDGELISVTQQAYGDSGRNVDIEAQYLYHFALDQEGDNFEGISFLRACYGAWLRKQAYLKYMAIGIEKNAIPTPIGKIPAGKENSDELAVFKEVLRLYVSHQSQYVTIPEGWEIEFKDNNFDPDKTSKAIDMEDKAIVKAFLANFLELGIGGGGGSYSLSFDQSDFFLGGIEYIAKTICEVFNNKIIPDLVALNYGEGVPCPKMEYSGISDRAGAELATTLKTLIDGQIIKADNKLEEMVRKSYSLPEADETTSRDMVKQSPIAFSEKGKKKVRNLMDEQIAITREVMQSNLRLIGQDMVKRIMSKYNIATKSQELGVAQKIEARFSSIYKEELQNTLTIAAFESYRIANEEVPSKVRQFSEKKFAKLPKTPVGMFSALPKAIQKRILNQSKLIVETQMADLEKAVYFQYGSSVVSTDSAKLLAADLEDGVETYVKGASVIATAGNTASLIINESRNGFFFDDEVLSEIESFTFVNEDPVSEICTHLNGRTFKADDPEAERYFPPLHHNCKSFLEPNFKGQDNPKINDNGLTPTSQSAKKSISLNEIDEK
jgi:SPP1 gp7 family putative phage head morphogenesis protein